MILNRTLTKQTLKQVVMFVYVPQRTDFYGKQVCTICYMSILSDSEKESLNMDMQWKLASRLMKGF